jgi:uncharacterized RDD family membrane protein YckC
MYNGYICAPAEHLSRADPSAFNPPESMELASRSSRLIGQVLDGCVVVFAFIPAAMFAAMSEELGIIAIVSVMLFAVFYYFLADSLPGGQSLGKRVVGIAVVDQQSHAPCSVGQSIVRNLLLSVLGLFDWVFIFGEQRRRLGDHVAGTIVVNAPPAYRTGFA